MTKEMQEKIVKALYFKDKELFFNKLESVTESTIEQNSFMVKQTIGWDTNGEHIIDFYELKKEIKELFPKMSLIEILQILKINDNDDVKSIKSIKNWVTFFGIITIIGIVVGIIVAIAS